MMDLEIDRYGNVFCSPFIPEIDGIIDTFFYASQDIRPSQKMDEVISLSGMRPRG